MEEDPPDSSAGGGCSGCACDCAYCGVSVAVGVKRKVSSVAVPARVAPANELSLLRSALASQQSAVRILQSELDAERSASASAASEAMAMILRLQRERADAVMDLRQFRRVADERSTHDQREIIYLEDQLYRRDHHIRILNLKIHSLRQRLLSVGVNVSDDDDDDDDVSSMDSPAAIEVIEDRISQLERSTDWLGSESVDPGGTRIERSRAGSTDFSNWWDKSAAVADAASPLSIAGGGGGFDSFSSAASAAVVDCSEVRVCTVDAVHAAADDYVSTPRERLTISRKEKVLEGEGEGEGGEINKLYTRLQALEADRESMRQAILAMSTEKVQAVLLREIAQQICDKEKKVVRRSRWSSFMRFSIIAAFKWVLSIFFRRKKIRIRYPFGMRGNAGLLLLLERSSLMQQRRLLSRTHRQLR